MITLNAALDPGFGGIKTAYVNGQGPQACTLPAVVASGSLKQSELSTGLGRGRAVQQPHSTCFEGYNYLVGPNVHHHARPVERLDFQRLSDGPELKALVYTSMWQALGDGDHCLNLLIGLPVEILQDRSLSSSTLYQLRAWLVGEHEFSVDGEITSLTINQVKAMAQPLGAFFCWGADDRGQWVQSDDPHAKFAVGDVGFNTFDAFVIEGARVNERYSGGDTLGLRRANSFIRSTIREQYGFNLSLHEADGYIRSRLANKRPILHHAQDSTDISHVVDQALDDNFAQIATYLEEVWGNGRQFRRILLTGGGSEALRERLLRLYPHALVLANAQEANAIGLAKYAQRESVFR